MGPRQIELIFDGSCPFCTACVVALGKFDGRQRIRAVPFQRPGVPEAAGLTTAQCEGAVWAILPDGRALPGAGGASAALDTLIGVPVFRALYRVPGIHQFEDALYGWVARHRRHLPGVTPYCARPGATCGGPPSPAPPHEGERV
ncbi:MAG: DUF393 domain-containing protein [Ktedonobacterales bacterium]|nr:DUF393 domain-containing protein [Ktedonobacterales bacterium]